MQCDESWLSQAADDAVKVVCERRVEAEDEGDFDLELSDAVDHLRWLLQQGADLSRTQRMSLREACRGQWFEGAILRIIARSKVPAEERRREWEDLDAWIVESNHEDEARTLADKVARASFVAQGEARCIRAPGYERRLARARSKKPRESARNTERRFVRQHCWQGE